ncbi:hypothetical protein TREES_T100008342 [Tupaia chinensis]|uniref:Uncharacterized protein n=1 Tax=Tupaia chinensis TaxID=246437 RepID=L9LB92_TUPCH|nr:hypothetical protein TREES_T100008342 [Tupaia chinensis]
MVLALAEPIGGRGRLDSEGARQSSRMCQSRDGGSARTASTPALPASLQAVSSRSRPDEETPCVHPDHSVYFHCFSQGCQPRSLRTWMGSRPPRASDSQLYPWSCADAGNGLSYALCVPRAVQRSPSEPRGSLPKNEAVAVVVVMAGWTRLTTMSWHPLLLYPKAEWLTRKAMATVNWLRAEQVVSKPGSERGRPVEAGVIGEERGAT